jgi:thymidylate kinase
MHLAQRHGRVKRTTMEYENPPTGALPHLVVFEGVDGTGKTTFAQALKRYYRSVAPTAPLYAGAFPGSSPGSLGEWVYRLHHGRASDLSPRSIAPPALQLLHVASHVDAIIAHIAPTLQADGYVILDRYWWSTYAYSRRHLPADYAWALVNAERAFWRELPGPTIIYLSRPASLKPHELDHREHSRLEEYYQEVIKAERRSGVLVLEVVNEGSLEVVWTTLLRVLQLKYHTMEYVQPDHI